MLMMFGRAGFPAPNEPSRRGVRSHQRGMESNARAAGSSLKDVFAQHPAWQPAKGNTVPVFPQLNEDGDLPNTWQLIAAGWGFVLFDPASVQADDGAGITRGIIGLVNKGQPRKPGRLGRTARLGMGRGPRTGLSRDRSGRRCKACRHRRRIALRQGRARHHGLRSALRHGPRRLVGQRRSHAAATQLRRGRREPHRRRVLLDGRQLHEVRRLRGNLRQQDSRRHPGRFE